MGGKGLYPPWEEPPPSLRVWALEPYFGGSHRQFLEGLAAFGRHTLDLFTLPGRHWKWRMHGGGLRLAELCREALRRPGAGTGSTPFGPSGSSRSSGSIRPQVLFASSMLDVPGFLAVAPPEAGRVPLILYMHENQLTYPLPSGVQRDLTYGLRQLAGAAAAESVLFNSHFHREEFLSACRSLLEEVPDEPPWTTFEQVASKARVLPLGVDLRRLDRYRPAAEVRRGPAGLPSGEGARSEPPLILWNQRWEYDKGPGEFFRALYALEEMGLEFRVAVAGAGQGAPSAEFAEARTRLADRLVHWGRADSGREYAELLWRADIVVSTALHDFFGVAVVEAIYCGCRPVLPAKLSYPELIPEEARAEVLYGDEGPVGLLRRAVEEGTPWSREWQRTWVARYDWAVMAPRYDREIWSCWQRGTGRAPLPTA
ncbi:MAG: DUF3524 domain-containing protein [Thermoleophilia bacterium]